MDDKQMTPGIKLVTLLGILLLLCAAGVPHARAQSANKPEVAVTFDVERSRIANTSCSCFWLKGASAEFAMPVFRGLGAAASVAGEHASNIQPGIDLSLLTYTAGPRYTLNSSRMTGGHASRIFGEFLIGGAHGFNSVFPGPSVSTSSANSFAFQTGGGFDVALAHRVSLRAVQVDYLHMMLPNAASNTQNDLRMAFGVAYRFSRVK